MCSTSHRIRAFVLVLATIAATGAPSGHLRAQDVVTNGTATGRHAPLGPRLEHTTLGPTRARGAHHEHATGDALRPNVVTRDEDADRRRTMAAVVGGLVVTFASIYVIARRSSDFSELFIKTALIAVPAGIVASVIIGMPP
jgi:hypothetical protein